MNQPKKDDRNNPKNQGESCSTGHQTGSSQTTEKDRDQGQRKEQNVGQGQAQKSGAQQPDKTGTTENQPQKKEQHSTAG